MSGVHHLSMRVPWRDRPWDQFICNDPLGNSSCTLLSNVGPRRDDAYEVAHAGAGIDSLDQDRLPCLSERATFMSQLGYSVTKTHPYAWNRALKDHLLPTAVAMPGYAFEAIPFRWLNRASFKEEIGIQCVPGFDPAAEDHVDRAIGFDGAAWVMDGHNQRAIIDAFFDSLLPGSSLVFVYLKHSPLQEQRTDRLLVGAARITGVTPPPMYDQAGRPPFSSSMWETVVEHSLRPDMADGVLLPYQQLVPLLDEGIDIDGALAWAPEGRDIEFSYVTEHLTDDAAIEALGALERAARGARALGVTVPDAAVDWIAAQTERLWQARGPVPGLAAALSTLGVNSAHLAARAVTDHVGEVDPWPLLESIFADPVAAPAGLGAHLPRPVGRIWTKLPAGHRAVLKLLSALDIGPGQVRMLLEGRAEVELEPEHLLDNLYLAAACTYGMAEHVPFATIDHALFPPSYVAWRPPVDDHDPLEGHLDRRRIEALLTEVLERQCAEGDTVVPVGEAVELANGFNLGQPVDLSGMILNGLDLDHDSLLEWPEWSPLTSVVLADRSPAYKLSRFADTADVIRYWVADQEGRAALGTLTGARTVLDDALARNQSVDTAPGALDESEDRARTEKAAGLSFLHGSPLAVLIGPAGTGKTTLLKALVETPGVADGGVLLLAPTGKARVQLETKVGLPAKTLASHLARSDRYDGDTGRYLVWGDARPRQNFGLVVIDEASMLTEEMLAATLDALVGVRRLILVGDPRQLPPIGAGRPFVDLVRKLRPATFDDWVRAAPGYVELQVPRRQLPDGSQGTRHDLELAACFGDGGRGAGDEAIWAELATTPNLPTVRYEPWGDRTAVEALTAALQEELAFDGHPDPERAFALTYGATLNGEYVNWEQGAGAVSERWQILAPTRSRTFGTVELNRHIKRTYRTADTHYGQRTARSNIAAPVGPELIVRGDKVMQTVNRRLKAYPKTGGLDYVANGEIGVGIGRVVPAAKWPKRSLALKVEFSSQPGYQYSYWPTKGEDVMLELAWAVTVHKSQGSEFGTTFLVLPARAAVSRELMYTALTRQKEKVVILHEGTLADLRDLAQPWRSETARRLTDLFAPPEPVSLKLRGEARRYDRALLHVSASGVPMASKNEVIIAGLLDQLVPGQWQYEQPFTGADGREVLPDFTFTMADGRMVLWEHAGMLDLPDYARKWELKKQWYAENGIRPHDAGGGPTGVLMWTDDRKGADAQAWLALAAEVIGIDKLVFGDSAPSSPRARRVPRVRRPWP